MIVKDLAIVSVFTVILMVALWLVMSRLAGDDEDSQISTLFVIVFIGICVFAFMLWIFWR